ncbi:WD40 repeat-like protein [Mycena galericulata]|nr:WD40 repeat-like protein [Mycena galericulata]
MISPSRETIPISVAMPQGPRLSSPVDPDVSRCQASGGVIRKGGVESRIDVITLDYVAPQLAADLKRPRTINRAGRDRFITSRDHTFKVPSQIAINVPPGSPSHTARLAAAAGVPLNRRILGYDMQTSAASSDQTLTIQRELVRQLYGQCRGAISTTTSKTRMLCTKPEQVLDAPGIIDDFYLNLLSWSSLNCVAQAPIRPYVCSVSFSTNGTSIAIGLATGKVEQWDAVTGTRLRTMPGHQTQVSALSWWQHVVSSGCADGSMGHHDVRVPRHKVMEVLAHRGDVCGLEWRIGEFIASGGNDNVVNIWDGRVGGAGPPVTGDGVATGKAKWRKRNHTAAVKALAWCPWQRNLLASGGGLNDGTINLWNSATGVPGHSHATQGQITSLHFSPHRKELLSTHGFPTNAISLWSYPGLERLAEIPNAHSSRILFSALSPAGDRVVTGAGDECLKFWRIWDAGGRKGNKYRGNGESATRSGVLSIR